LLPHCSSVFSFNVTATTDIYTLSLHDALPIFLQLLHIINNHNGFSFFFCLGKNRKIKKHNRSQTKKDLNSFTFHNKFFLLFNMRSEEHTSELQSRENLVCRLLLEKKKK